MGQCVYCDEPAGFLRRSHGECRESHAQGVETIVATVADVEVTAADAATRIESLAQSHRVRGARFDDALADAWAVCVERHLASGMLDGAEEERLATILGRFGKRREDIDAKNLWPRVRQARLAAAEPRIAESLGEAVHARADAENDARSLADIEGEIEATAREFGVATGDVGAILLRSVEAAVDRVLDDELLTADEEHAIVAVAKHFGIAQVDLDRHGAWTRMVKAAILRDLTEGVVAQRVKFDRLPFRLQKSETMIWVFHDVDYSTVRTRREFRGRSAGVSVRVAKGVYFRTGGFKGHPVEVEETVHVDTGMLGVTTRHIYFAGASQSFRVRLDRIVTVEPYSDGVGIMRETARAKPETFVLGDGWFAYNLLQNIET